MPGKVFFDTNILVYTLAEDDPRSEVAETLLAGGGVVSVHVLNEFVAVARKKLRLSWAEINDALAAIRTLCPSPVPITVATHETALRIAEERQYHIYDALVAATALEAGCSTLYSEDLQSGQEIDRRLIIVSPFGNKERTRSRDCNRVECHTRRKTRHS